MSNLGWQLALSNIIPSDPNITKSIIKFNKVPPFSGKSGKLSLRYRIVSEDKNRISEWSKIHELTVPTISSPYTYTVTTQKVGTTNLHEIIITWTLPSGTLEQMVERNYDIFVATNTVTGEPTLLQYTYLQTQLGWKTVRLFLNKDTVTNFNVIVHKETFDKVLKSDQILVKTTKTNL